MTASPDTQSLVDPLLGRVLDGRFRILSPIARGGMGAVYKAEQAPLGRLVALKVLSPRADDAANAEFRRRFLLEASTCSKLTHPNTVRVFDYGQTEDGFFFIAMELVEGRTLKHILAEKGAFDATRAAEVAKQVGRSLREAHRMGIVHRDIKPGNVMLVEREGEEQVKVLDFGLAKDLTSTADPDDATQTGVFLGSPKYVSPEQVQGEPLDGRSDVYSLGVVLYEMLSGRPPFVHEQPMQVLMAHVRETPGPLSSPAGREPIPASLEAIVMRCLAKSPDERWPDMEALLLALKDWQGTTSVSGDLGFSRSSESDPRSGVHSVTGPGHTPTLDRPVEALRRAPEAPEIGASAEMRGSNRAIGPLVLTLVLALVLVGGGLVWASDPSSNAGPAPAAPPPRDPSVAILAEPPETTTLEPSPPENETPEPGPPARVVLLSLRSTPAGAMVQVGDRDYGPTPTEIELTGPLAAEGTGLDVVFRHDGYRPRTEHLTVDAERLEISARLSRRGSGGRVEAAGGSTGDVHVEGYRDSPY